MVAEGSRRAIIRISNIMVGSLSICALLILAIILDNRLVPTTNITSWEHLSLYAWIPGLLLLLAALLSLFFELNERKRFKNDNGSVQKSKVLYRYLYLVLLVSIVILSTLSLVMLINNIEVHSGESSSNSFHEEEISRYGGYYFFAMMFLWPLCFLFFALSIIPAINARSANPAVRLDDDSY